MYFGKDMPVHAAALAFYTIFFLPSMLFIVMWTAARFYKEVAVREAIFTEISGLVGQVGTQQLMATLEKPDIHEPTWWSTVWGFGILLFTTTTVLVTMHNALNRIFEVNAADTDGLVIWKMVCDRLVSFTLVVTIAFILLVSLVVDAMITALGLVVVKWAGDLYEAAGSVLVLMLWVYCASAIFLFEATFTFTRARLISSGRNELP